VTRKKDCPLGRPIRGTKKYQKTARGLETAQVGDHRGSKKTLGSNCVPKVQPWGSKGENSLSQQKKKWGRGEQVSSRVQNGMKKGAFPFGGGGWGSNCEKKHTTLPKLIRWMEILRSGQDQVSLEGRLRRVNPHQVNINKFV